MSSFVLYTILFACLVFFNFITFFVFVEGLSPVQSVELPTRPSENDFLSEFDLAARLVSDAIRSALWRQGTFLHNRSFDITLFIHSRTYQFIYLNYLQPFSEKQG